jgi:hypothetical protein
MLASADEIADAVKRYKERLFARNIRGFVGTRNPVNSEIRQTIAEAPNDFKFLNNGLTIVCERMQFTTDGRRNRVTLSKPSVVNGQQTATTLRLARDVPQSDVPGEEPRTLSLAGIKVPIRVIVVDRNRSEGDAYQDFISAVVKATNFQTKVTIPDLYANNWRQVDLGRRMRRAGFYYARKNETKTESRRQAGGRPIVDRRVLADAVGGCVEESLPHRLTKEMLYKEGVDAEVGNYEKIFDVSKPVEFFLTRYYLWQIVRDVLKGGIVDKPQEVGKWLVLFDIEQRIGRALDTRPTRFMTEAVSSGGTDDDTIAYCRTLVELLGEAVARFYERRHGTGQLPDDIAGFFKTRNLQPTFRAFLRSNGNRGREQRIGRAVADFRASLTM